MTVNTRFARFICMTGFLLIPSLSLAAEDTKPAKLFNETAEMNVTLTGPWHKIRRNVKKDKLYPIQITYAAADGKRHTIEAKAAPRGISRRLDVCTFPPLKIHFDKSKLKNTPFRGNNSLKLVTYCQTNSKYEQYYITEYLVYRIYNLITDYSFRVRPMIVEYSDSERSGKVIRRFSFFIEDVDEVAKRNNLKKLSVARVHYKQLDPLTSSQFSLFQLMIGNLDWAATSGPEKDSCCHNSRLIGTGNGATPKYGIPYDFDSSGLVNTHYAVPPDGLKVRNIRQRLYRGFCVFNDSLPQAAKQFNDKKTDILALFKNNPHLNKRSRESAVSYIEGFYEILNEPKLFKQEITDKCRGQPSPPELALHQPDP